MAGDFFSPLPVSAHKSTFEKKIYKPVWVSFNLYQFSLKITTQKKIMFVKLEIYLVKNKNHTICINLRENKKVFYIYFFFRFTSFHLLFLYLLTLQLIFHGNSFYFSLKNNPITAASKRQESFKFM